MKFKRFLGIDDVQEQDTALLIFKVRDVIKKSNFEVICTTDNQNDTYLLKKSYKT